MTSVRICLTLKCHVIHTCVLITFSVCDPTCKCKGKNFVRKCRVANVSNWGFNFCMHDRSRDINSATYVRHSQNRHSKTSLRVSFYRVLQIEAFSTGGNIYKWNIFTGICYQSSPHTRFRGIRLYREKPKVKLTLALKKGIRKAAILAELILYM